MNTAFSVNIYKEQLNIKNKPLINYLLKLKKQDSKGRNISNPTGWQSFDLNVGQNVFLELAKEIDEINPILEQFQNDLLDVVKFKSTLTRVLWVLLPGSLTAFGWAAYQILMK